MSVTCSRIASQLNVLYCTRQGAMRDDCAGGTDSGMPNFLSSGALVDTLTAPTSLAHDDESQAILESKAKSSNGQSQVATVDPQLLMDNPLLPVQTTVSTPFKRASNLGGT